jgi:hypothetical protein
MASNNKGGYKIKDTSKMHHTAWNKGLKGEEYKKHYPTGMKGIFQKGNKIVLGKHWKLSNIAKQNMSIAKLNMTEQNRINIGLGHRDEKNGLWKGEMAGKGNKHSWVERRKGTPNKCEICGTTNAKRYEWCNIDHKYHRVLEDYFRACTSCHRLYDIKNNGYVGGRKKKWKILLN